MKIHRKVSSVRKLCVLERVYNQLLWLLQVKDTASKISSIQSMQVRKIRFGNLNVVLIPYD